MKAIRLGLASFALVLGLTACPGITDPGQGPTINDFSADPSVINAGQTSTLSWDVEGATSLSISPELGNVTGTEATVTPSVTTVYTLTATNAGGESSTKTTTVTVSGTDTGNGGGGGSMDGTFGVSTSATGTFTNDSDESGGSILNDTDPRIISVTAPGTFYAQVQYASSSSPIVGVDILLVNSTPPGIRGPLSTEDRAGFTLGTPTGDQCDLTGTATEITCVYPITVAAGTPDIEDLQDAGDEFAYVFRVEVTDAAGTEPETSTRGYVNIE